MFGWPRATWHQRRSEFAAQRLRDGPRYSATTRGLIFLVVSRKLSNYAPFKGNMYLRVCTIGANHAICVLALRTLRHFSVQAGLACVLE